MDRLHYNIVKTLEYLGYKIKTNQLTHNNCIEIVKDGVIEWFLFVKPLFKIEVERGKDCEVVDEIVYIEFDTENMIKGRSVKYIFIEEDTLYMLDKKRFCSYLRHHYGKLTEKKFRLYNEFNFINCFDLYKVPDGSQNYHF